MVTHFTAEEDKRKLIAIFEELDVDKNGTLDKEEVARGFHKYYHESITKEEIDQIFERIDRNTNNSIDYTEFVIATVDKKKLLAKKNLESTFKLIDKDGSNFITADELKEFFLGQSKDHNEDVWPLLVKEVDSNSDGRISLSEFKEMMFKLL